MAVSTCMKCAGHSFELALLTPIGESRKLTIVQCSTCGAPVGVLDPATGPQIEALTNQVTAIDERLNDHGYILPGLGDAGDRMFGTK